MSQLISGATLPEMEGGIVKRGHEDAMELCLSVLQEHGLPLGLLQLADVIEVGFVKNTGFFWVRQKSRVEHYFKKAGKLVSYEPEIKGYIHNRSIKTLTGVKAKMLLWLSISDITINETSLDKIVFQGMGGVFRTFPVEVFALGE